MKREIAEKIVEACEADGIDARLYKDYSGRGMCGTTTDGVVVPCMGDAMSAVINNSELFTDAGLIVPQGFRQDNLGRRTIIY